MLQHGLRVEVGDQEGDVVSLLTEHKDQSSNTISIRGDPRKLTAIAFLLKITNPSARMVMNRVNFLHKIRSISSACLIAIESLIELILVSIRTRSDSFLEIRRGWRSNSWDDLYQSENVTTFSVKGDRENSSQILARLPLLGSYASRLPITQYHMRV